MRKEVIECDVCGKPNAQRVDVFIDRVMGPAGSSDDEWGAVDLCHAHAVAELNRFLGKHVSVKSHVTTGIALEGKPWIDRIKARRKS